MRGAVQFPISDYRYAGFGAFFFVDFILFRIFLGITDMVSIEHDIANEKRVLFNQPFRNIDIKFQSSSDYISEICRDKMHILWLDYDTPIKHEQLIDLENAVHILSPGSVLIVTFDVDFDKANDLRIRESLQNERAKAWYNMFKDECGDFFDPGYTISDFNAAYIPKRTIQAAKSSILSGINMRNGIHFEPLFNFSYADGHEMLTIGGIICSKTEKRKLRVIDWPTFVFIRREFSEEPFRIDVPTFTRKERLCVDANMPCETGWVPEEFEIDPEVIHNYREIYRYCPLYAELLVI